MPNKKQTNSGVNEQREGKLQLLGWVQLPSYGRAAPKGIRAQPRPGWAHLGSWGCKSTLGHLKNRTLIAFGKSEVGKGLVGAHWLIKVFVVLGIKWEMLQGCLSCWDCEAKALGAVWERDVCTGSGFLAIRRNTPEAFRERSGINALRTMKTLAQLWLSVRRKSEAAFHQIFFARVFYAS